MFGNKRIRRFINNTGVSSNKRFSKRLPIATKKSKKIFSKIFGILLAGFLIYLLFFSNFFTVTEIIIENQTLENKTFSDEIEKTVSSTIGKNLILTNTSTLTSKIFKTFPELKMVEISKNYPSTIEINFEQHPLAANIVNESKTLKKSYIINSIGQIIKEDYEDKNLPYIRIKSDEPINPKETIIDQKTLTTILDTRIYFEDKFGMRVKEILYKPIAREIHLLTEKECYIWLDIQKPIESQLKKLKKALVKLDIYNENLEYIDLRVSGTNGDKIIYKRR